MIGNPTRERGSLSFLAFPRLKENCMYLRKSFNGKPKATAFWQRSRLRLALRDRQLIKPVSSSSIS